MGAPTWPPTPEEAFKATLEEYGDDARKVMEAETDEEAERALLAHFLFRPPARELASGEVVGTGLDDVSRSLSAWLRMITDLDVQLAASDPPSTDGESIYLPRAVPAPALPPEDRLLFRAMALIQAGFLQFGLLRSRPLLAEIHRDWVLRSAFHLLAVRYIIRRWSEVWPGVAADFRAARALDKAAVMRVGVTVVPTRGMPRAFLPLYEGLIDFVEEAGEAGGPARRAAAAVDAITNPAAAMPVIVGQAQSLRQHFRSQRLGPPPLPYFAGILRPEWLLHDLREEMRAAEAWKEGPKPLRILRDAMKRKGRTSPGRTSQVSGKMRRFMRADPGPTMAPEAEPPPERDDDARQYDEWDDNRGAYKLQMTRVVEVDAPGGPLASYERIVTANQGTIKEVRRRFAALRLEERWLHGQPDGSELDLNRAISAVADIKAGYTPRTDWYKRFQRQKQSVALVTLVDLSGSTQGNIIRLEQEALVLLSEGLRAVRFPHALAGFSNHGPRECRIQKIKPFDTEYDDRVHKRMANLRPGGATRLGAFIRHGTWMLSQRPEGRRLLMLISDGRPHCQGEYRERYGVRDSAMAVREAVRAGVFIFCLSLDTHEEAKGYLHEIFGPGRYLMMERPDDLPVRLPEVLRGLVA